jgi:hypothetical protein
MNDLSSCVVKKTSTSRLGRQAMRWPMPGTLRFYKSLLRAILERDENPKNYQRTLRPLYRLNFSSQVITGISSDKAWAMI